MTPDLDGTGSGRAAHASAPSNVIDIPQMRRSAPRVAARQPIIPPSDRLRAGRKESRPANGTAGKAGKDRPPARGAKPDEVDGDVTWAERVRNLMAGKVMTKTEVAERRDDLVRAYRLFADHADDFLSNTNRAHAKAVIWSTLQDDELEKLADLTLLLAQRNPVIAQAVRGMIQTADILAIGSMLGSRAWLTLLFYAQNGGFGIWLPTAAAAPQP